MVKQVFDIDSYWKVIVYYDMDYNFFDDVIYELRLMGFPKAYTDDTRRTMLSGKAQAVTCSNTDSHSSLVIFNRHSSEADYINSIVHEAEHVKQAILNAYDIEDAGEPPAYTIGFIVMKMYEIFRNLNR